MFVLLAFFITSAGAVSTVTAEFNSAETCEAARTTWLGQVPAPTKVATCAAK